MKNQIYTEQEVNGLLDKINEFKAERDKWVRMGIKLASLLKVEVDTRAEVIDAIKFKDSYIREFDKLIEEGIQP